MLLWFAIMAPILVAEIFRSPMVDYRMVAIGAVLPVLEVVTGRALVLHTLLGSVAALGLVMALTQQRRLVRRRWLGIPIGLMFHLVLDGTWTSKALMWWPVFGVGFEEAVPEFSRGAVVPVLLELVAVGAGWWAWRRYELDQLDNRTQLFRTGQLVRGVL
ncbi:MAG: hypothetical protein R2733_20780 [Acidimicrobiales bacterium]